MHANAHGVNANGTNLMWNINSRTEESRWETSFRELLSSHLASLEEVLLTAHLNALASVCTRPDSARDAWGPVPKVSVLQTDPEEVVFADNPKAANWAPTKPDPPTDAWGPSSKAAVPKDDPRCILSEDEGTHADSYSEAVKFAAVVPEVRESVLHEPPKGLHSPPKTLVRCVTFEGEAERTSILTDYEDELQDELGDLPGELPHMRMSAQSMLSVESNDAPPMGYVTTEKIRADKAAWKVKKGKFELLALWKDRSKKEVKRKQPLTRAVGAASLHFNGHDSINAATNPTAVSQDEENYIDEMEQSEKFMIDHPHVIESEWWLRNYFLLPNSVKRASWDVLSLVFVAWDVVFLPLGFFELPESPIFSVMMWFTRLFWTFDIPMSLLTGYLRLDGTIEMRPKKIMKKYLYTWFPLDIAIVLSDWFEMISSGFGYARVTKASRTFRIIRMIRLVRVAKIQQIIGLLVERLQSEAIHTIVEMAQIMCLLLIVAHLVACIWWGIGSRDAVDTWVEEKDARRLPFSEQYALSLHWSISQFTGGMDEIQAQHVSERYFVIGVFLFCFILASLFVSSLTSSMTHLQLIANKQTRQIQKLRRFLSQNNISGRTALRIQRNAQHAVAEQQRLMPEKDVELLNMVSEPLRYELHFEMYSEFFDSHLFFGRYKNECPAVVRKVCHFASSVSLVSRGDIIFCAGELPDEPTTYAFFEGCMNYVGLQGDTSLLHLQQWISEAALWTTWRHQGVLTALADCRLYTLDAKRFQAIVGQFEHLNFDPRRYAQAYVKDLNRLETEELTDLSFHLISPGADKAALKPKTEVYHLCKDEYNMKIASHSREANAFLHIPRITMGGGVRLSSWH